MKESKESAGNFSRCVKDRGQRRWLLEETGEKPALWVPTSAAVWLFCTLKANLGKVKGASVSLRRSLRCRKAQDSGHRSKQRAQLHSQVPFAGCWVTPGPINLSDGERSTEMEI